MKIKLAENIRQFRKDRALTQEQLAEVLGVTTGAVYKWEAQLSNPELNLIMEMADFFDTSVDVLLGYEMKDNRLSACIERLKTYRHNKDPQGLAEAAPFLSDALLNQVGTLIRIIIGYVNVFLERGDTSASQDILLWGSTLLSGLKTTGKRSFLDKMNEELSALWQDVRKQSPGSDTK